MCAKKWDLSDLNGDNTASSVGLVPWRLLVSVSTKVIKIYWCHRRDTNPSEACLNPSGQNLSIRRFNKGQLYDLSRLSEARHLKQRPFSGLVINVNKNTVAGYSPIISIHCVNVAISKTSITLKSVFFIRCRRSDSSIFVDKWNLTAATIARSFSQRPQAAIRQLRTWPRIHVQPRFQWGFRNSVTFLRVVYWDCLVGWETPSVTLPVIGWHQFSRRDGLNIGRIAWIRDALWVHTTGENFPWFVHRGNTSSSQPPSLIAVWSGNHHLICPCPTLAGVLPAVGWVVAYQTISPLFSTAFDGAFDRLQLIRATLIFKMIKNFIKQTNYAYINTFHKKRYWFKIRMEFLLPISGKTELICQQPAMSQWGLHR